MLNSTERHQVTKFNSYFLIICLLPAKVDVKTWGFYPGCPTKWKDWACKLSYALFAVHALYKVARLLSGFLILQSSIPLHHVIIHLAVATAAAMAVFWYYLLFIKYPDVYLNIMKISLSGSFGQGKNSSIHDKDSIIPMLISRVLGMTYAPPPVEAAERRQRWYKRLLEYSLQDFIAMYMPHMVSCGVVLVWACYIYDSSLRLLLYSALPARRQSWLTFIVCFVEEIRLLLIAGGIIVPVLQLQ